MFDRRGGNHMFTLLPSEHLVTSAVPVESTYLGFQT
jgi:hypothetical protein